ncbi:SPT3 Dosage dependent suppressor of Ty-induced promoter mutations-like protein [Mortierella alpina]|nr:SPT3 Dosage dependent suppressor of Ty-induced promoter mutations-like protein [Mortierella alpina]
MRPESRQAHPPSFASSSSSSSSLSSSSSPSSFLQRAGFGEASSEMDHCDPSIGNSGTFSVSNYPPWTKADSLLGQGTHHASGTARHYNNDQNDEIIRRLSYSSAGSEMNTRASSMMDENDLMSAYSLDVRIIQKKDQLEELSAIGAAISAPVVEEVRTGQQFLIKLHLSRNGVGHASRLPSLRVSRRVAINTAGESRTDPDPLTLEIAVHLAKSGQVRKDPATYAHVDTTTGSITMLAKVVCSSTDHGERGNKDRYIFEFKLKRSNNGLRSHSNSNGSSSMDSPEDDGETIAACFTPAIMASGHHKAKRMYPHPRPSKITKGGPTPKTKISKRHKSEPNIMTPFQGPADGSMLDHSGFSSTMPFLAEHLSQVPMMASYSNHSTDTSMQPHSVNGQHSGGYTSSLPHPSAPMQPPHQSQPFPRITTVRPDHGPIRKTTDVVLRGGFFREGMIPYFGCFPAQDIIVETASLIICKAPESPLPGAVSITIYDSIGNSFADLGQFTYTDDSETELLILQLQLRLAHRALEYLHTQATGRKGNAVDILKDIPGLSTSPRSGSLLMDAAEEGGPSAEAEETPQVLSLSQVEQGVLDMLDQLPYGMDISLQLEDGSNLLHLSLLLGFDTLTERLIEEGCDIEAQDAWLMTPLMYAVLKGNTRMARSLVLAGASSSGARTPQEFCDILPWVCELSGTMVSILSISCSRYFGTSRSFSLDSVEEGLEHGGADDEGRASSSGEPDDNQGREPTEATTTRRSAVMLDPEDAVANIDSASRPTVESGSQMMTQLADALQGIHTYHGMPPLDQQDLPPLHTVESDGSITINTKVIKTNTALGAEMYTNVNPESGYHSGVISEVQKRLNRLHMATLPSEGVQMTVLLKKLSPTRPAPSSSITRSTPLELFRTGDSFNIEIRLATTPSSLENGEQAFVPMPKEYLGIRFPHEMVKRVSGRPALILSEMTYSLRMTMELGKAKNLETEVSRTEEDEEEEEEEEESRQEDADIDDEQSSGPLLSGACQACSKYLHEHRKLSPSRRSVQDPWMYPILQFSVPGGPSVSTSPRQHQEAVSHPASSTYADQSGVVELREGVCEVKAKVNCSSMHHLIQRERAKRTASKQQKQKDQGQHADQESSSTGLSSSLSAPLSTTSTPVLESAASTESEGSDASSACLSLRPSPSKQTKKRVLTDLQDPGFVFKFELIHPTLNTVVAHYNTQPILFQTYARGRV